MSRKRRDTLILIAAGIVLAAAAWVFWPISRAFDQAAWKDEERVQEGVRLAMADRIVTRRMLSGMIRSEVVSMLGEPPKTGYFSDWHLVYWLGPERGFMSIDSEWLVVRLDAEQRVSDYRIVRD